MQGLNRLTFGYVTDNKPQVVLEIVFKRIVLLLMLTDCLLAIELPVVCLLAHGDAQALRASAVGCLVLAQHAQEFCAENAENAEL